MPIIIYTLNDPRNNQIRYVGKTEQKFSYRLNGHLQDVGRCHRVNWINELKALGLKPLIKQLEIVRGDNWKDRERFWIKKFRELGFNLTNNTSGGDGVCGLPQETRDRMRLTWLGRKHSPETIATLIRVRGLKRFRHKKSSKLKMSNIMKGRKILWVDKIAEANRKLTKYQVESIKLRLERGELNKNLAAEFGVDRTTLSKVKMGTYFMPYRAVYGKNKLKLAHQPDLIK